MNKIYYSIWSESLGTWVAVSELTQNKNSKNCLKKVISTSKDYFLSSLAIGNLFKLSLISLACLGFTSTAIANICGDVPLNGVVICNGDSTPVSDTTSLPDIIYTSPVQLTIDGSARPLTLNGVVSVQTTAGPSSITLTGNVSQNLTNTTHSVAIGDYSYTSVPHEYKIDLDSGVKLNNSYISRTGVFYNVAARVDNNLVNINSKASITSSAVNSSGISTAPLYHAGLMAVDVSGGNNSRVSVVNSGNINLTSYDGMRGSTWGIQAMADGVGSPSAVNVENSGAIYLNNPVNSSLLNGIGVSAINMGVGGVNVKNSGKITLNGYWNEIAYGILVRSSKGNVSVDSGSINLKTLGPARGIEVSTSKNATINVTGDIYAIGQQGASVGVFFSPADYYSYLQGSYLINVSPNVTVKSNGIAIASYSPNGGTINLGKNSVITTLGNKKDEYAIVTYTYNDVINSSGNIIGIVDMNAGNDKFSANGGSVAGSILMGEGNDKLVLSNNFDATKISSLMGQDGNDSIEFLNTVASLGGEQFSNWETIKVEDNARLLLKNSELVLSNDTGLNSTTKGLYVSSAGTLLIPRNFVLTGDVHNSGLITLRSAKVGHQLQINGDYYGNGSQIYLNAKLAGDKSVTDKLVINGNTSGLTNVKIFNIKGTGAATINGIKVIEVSGNSNGIFVLSEPVQVGSWEYLLNKKGNNWYLESISNPGVKNRGQTYEATDPEELFLGNEQSSETLSNIPSNQLSALNYDNQPQIYRPGVSAYALVQNLSNEMLSSSIGNLQQRLGEQYNPSVAACFPDSNPGVFPKNNIWSRYESQSLTAHGKTQFNLKSNSVLFQFGADVKRIYNETDQSRTQSGVLFNLASTDADVANRARNFANLQVDTGSIKARQLGLGSYLTHYTKNGAYADFVGQINQISSDFKDIYGGESVQRSTSISLSSEMGKPQKLGHSKWLFEPQAQFQYHLTAHNGFSDQVSDIKSYVSQSARLRFGARMTWNSETQLPSSETEQLRSKTFYASASLAKELLSNSVVNVGGSKVTEDFSQNPWLELGIGGQIPVYKNAFLFGQIQAQKNLGGEKRSVLSGNMGLRVNW